MNRLFSKKSLLLFVTTLVFIISYGQAGIVPVNPPTGGFSIDGYLQRQGPGGDWLEGPSGSPSGTFLLTDDLSPLFTGAAFTWAIDAWNSNSDETFKNGKNRFNDNPNNWKWHYKKSASRYDINNSLLYFVRDNVGHIWAILSGDRFNTNGTSYIDFEFFQNPVARTPPVDNNDGGFFSTGPNNGRTIGDLVVSVGLGGQGTIVQVLQWSPVGDPLQPTFDYVSVAQYIQAGFIYAAINTETIEVPFGTFGSTLYPPGTFTEIAVDMSGVLGGFSPNPPECSSLINLPFKTLFIKSKASPALNAQLIDFIEPLSLPPNLTFGINVSVIPLDLYTLELTASVSPGSVDDYLFSWEPSIYNPPGGNLSNNNSYTTLFTTTNPETCVNYIYTVRSVLKSDPQCSYSEARVTIQAPCKIGKPINPNGANLGSNEVRDDGNAGSEIQVYPNPNKGAATIVFPDAAVSRDIDLIDMKGSTVQRWRGVISNSLQIKDLQTGVYLLKIISTATGKVTTKKIIVNN
ncbi:MAG: T9SS type A sorting domain-containing protein [Chitinophagaceae bacterium]|nr:MAG: T9SS type A sorting domain-containing protein [Chitinophagaceae bacterium]